MGGRMSFSAHLSDLLKLFEERNSSTPEFKALSPVFQQQQKNPSYPNPTNSSSNAFREGTTVFYRSKAMPFTRPWPVDGLPH